MKFIGFKISVLLALTTLLVQSCDSGMKVDTKSKAGTTSCTDPSLPECTASQEFRIDVAAEIINSPSFAVTWQDKPSVSSDTKYLLDVTSDADCQDKVASFETTDREFIFDFLRDGTYYICLQSYNPLKPNEPKLFAVNNGFKIVLDRTPPELIVDVNLEKGTTFNPEAVASDTTTLLYSWGKVSGPGEVTFSDRNSLNPNISMSEDGEYVLIIKALDQAGNIAEQTITIKWDRTAPVVNVGADQQARTSIAAIATVDDTATTMRWSMISGPTGGKIAFSDPSKATTDVMADKDGNYVIRLTAADEYGNEGYDELTYTRDTTPPVVDAGADVTTGAPINVTGTATGAVSVAWSKVSGPGVITFGSATTVATSVTADTVGTYILKIMASDLLGNAASDTMILTWSSSNVPTVNVGNDKAIKVATNIDATTQNVDSWLWTQVSGPGTVTFGSATAEDTTVMADADGVYVVRLEGTRTMDSVSEHDDVTVTVDTAIPTVDVGADVTSNSLLTIDATSSGTPNNNQTYQWSKQSGPGTITFGTPTAEDTTAIASVDGAYVLRLTVTDIAGNVAFDEMNYTKDSAVPVVNAGADLLLAAMQTINATVTGATTYAWTQESGPGPITFGSANAEDTSVTANQDGTYVLKLSATDNASNTGFDLVTVTWDTSAPTVNAGADVSKNASFTQSGTASGYSTLAWSKFSGPGNITFGSATSLSTSVAADADGTYVLRLTATDQAGNAATDDVTVVWDTAAPTVNAGADITAKTTAALDATIAGSTTITWTKQSGPGSITFSAPNSEDTNASASADGTYVLMVTASDAAGNNFSDTLTFIWDTTAPTVNAGVDVMTGVQVLLNAVTTGATTYQWSVASGTGNITFGSATAEDTTVSADTEGAYVLRLDVTDAAGNTASDFVNFSWDVTPPSVNVGTDISTSSAAAIDATVIGGATYLWSKVSGPGNLNFSAGTSIDTNVSASADGIYVVRLTATDSAGNSASDDLTLDWDNNAPSVNVGADIVTNVIKVIDATATGGVTHQWTKQSGPGAITFGSATSIDTSVTADTDGVYLLRLTATDGASNANFDEISFTWDTAPPGVNVGADVLSKVQISIDATTTDAVSFGWTKIAGPGTITFGSPTSEDTTASASADGVYTLQLTVTDAAGNIAVDQMTFTWDTTPPTVNSGADQTDNSQVTFDASTSGASTYAWTKVSGPGNIVFGTATAEDTTASADADGTYILRLTATDASGNSASDDLTLIWDSGAPTVNAGSDISGNAIKNTNATVTGATSYQWTKQSGPGAITFGSETSINTSIVADTDGTYVLRLAATDAAGNASFDELTFIWDTDAPTVNAGADVTSSTQISINATSSGATTYGWIKVAGPGTITFGSPASEDTTASASADGVYVLQLSVTDSAGNITSDQMTLTWDTAAPSVNAGADINTNTQVSLDAATAGGTTYAWTKQSGPGTVNFGSATAEDTTASATADGTYVLRLTVMDVANNSAFDEITFIWDTTVSPDPQFTSIDLINDAENGYVNLTERSSALKMVGNLSASTFDVAAYQLVAFGATCSAQSSYSTTIPTANTVDFAADGDYKVCVRLSKAGRANVYGESSKITKDIVAPTFTSLPLKNDAIGGFINAAEVAAAAEVVGPLSGTDIVSSQYALAASTATCSNVVSWGNLPTADLLAGFGDGTLKVCVKMTDVAGNIAYNSSPNFVLDKTAPAFSYLLLVNSEVGTTEVAGSAALVSTVVGSGFDDARYEVVAASTPTCTTVTYDGSDNVIPTASDISGLANGSYKVCSRLVDDAGNPMAYGASGSFALDQSPPTLPSNPEIFLRQLNATSAYIGWMGATDSTSEAEYRVYVSTSSTFDTVAQVESGTPSTDWTSEVDVLVTGLTADTSYYINVISKDSGGNKIAYQKLNVTTYPEMNYSMTEIALGDDHACALTGDNRTFCWGDGDDGSLAKSPTLTLGINADSDDVKHSPIRAAKGYIFTKLTAGDDYTCGVATNNNTYCWGEGSTDGQIGDNGNVDRPEPALVSGGYSFNTIDAGYAHTCGRLSNGVTYCWGDGDSGQLGNNGNANSPVPVLVTGGYDFTQISAGFQFSCARRSTGAAYCWGENAAGQLGINDGTYADRSNPTLVSGGLTWSMVSAGGDHACGLTSAGAAYCWGGNGSGQLGDNTQIPKLVPTAVAGGHTFSSIYTGMSMTCALKSDGSAYCWGLNDYGQLGINSTANALVPTAVQGSKLFTKISLSIGSSSGRACGLANDLKVYCWGPDLNGAMGNGVTVLSPKTPAPITFMPYYKFANPMANAGFAYGMDNYPYAWGRGDETPLGDMAYPNYAAATPAPLVKDMEISSFTMGVGASCGVSNNGKAYCWGYGDSLGTGNYTGGYDMPYPVEVTGDRRWKKVYQAGQYGYSNCGVTTALEVYCWGYDDATFGAGTGSDEYLWAPLRKSALEQFDPATLAFGYRHGCGKEKTSNNTYCWGVNTSGVLGIGSAGGTYTPVLVSGSHVFAEYYVANIHNCARKTNGEVYCWGNNTNGELGDTTIVSKYVPTLVSGGINFAKLAKGDGQATHSCGISTSQDLYCWGDNARGQLGDGTIVDKTAPTLVLDGYKWLEVSTAIDTTCGITTEYTVYCWGDDRFGNLGNDGVIDTVSAFDYFVRPVSLSQ
ncbi:MAG: Ig-like domain repeat protein [Oligoflexales bacterium]